MSSLRRRLPQAGLVALALAAVAGALVLAARDRAAGPLAPAGFDAEGEDPFAFETLLQPEFEKRAAAGFSHVLYAKSPRGAAASARRTARWRPLIEAEAGRSDLDPDVLEAIVFLESAGRPDAIAGADPGSASGLTQIVAETGSGLLGMRLDLQASRKLTRRIERAGRRRNERRAARLRARRRKVDDRFDPRKALAATGRYLRLAQERFGRADLAVVSYHMGIGNLERALRAYAGDEDGAVEDVVEDTELSYARLYFDSSPEDHPEAWRVISSLGDDSATYYWRVLASRELMRLSRENPAELDRLVRLHAAKDSSEEVLHPPDEAEVFDDPDELRDAYSDGELGRFPDAPITFGLRRDPRMGELAERVDAEPEVYRGLRPEALALAAYLAAKVRDLSNEEAPLTVTSTVRDRGYQRVLARRNGEATHAFSLHTTGYAFDVRRSYRSRRQALALEFMLGRLQALNMIAWVREPAAIHITVSSEAKLLEPLLVD